MDYYLLYSDYSKNASGGANQYTYFRTDHGFVYLQLFLILTVVT